MSALKKICLVIGDPIAHSLSPLIHQAAYRELGIEDRYVYLAARVKGEDLENAVLGFRALGVLAVSCTIPHKQNIMRYLDEIDEDAKKIGAVNTVISKEDKLIGYNTDVVGVLKPLLKRTTLKNKKVLLLGAGGAARAAAFGFSKENADLTICNRTANKAETLAKELCASTLAWNDREKAAKDFDIIFNATSLGLNNLEQGPLSPDAFREKQIVFDAVYDPYYTEFLKNAIVGGAEVIHGTEMLIEQAAQQILLYSGMPAPSAIMEKVLLEKLCVK